MDVVRFLRKKLKKEAKLLFPEEDIYDSLHHVIVNKIEIQKPSFNAVKRKKQKITENSAIQTKAPVHIEKAPPSNLRNLFNK